MWAEHDVYTSFENGKEVFIVHHGIVCRPCQLAEGIMGHLIGEVVKVSAVCIPIHRIVADHPQLVGSKETTSPSRPEDHHRRGIYESLDVSRTHSSKVAIIKDRRLEEMPSFCTEVVDVLGRSNGWWYIRTVSLSKMISRDRQSDRCSEWSLAYTRQAMHDDALFRAGPGDKDTRDHEAPKA